MKIAHSSIYYPHKFTHKISESITVNVQVTHNRYHLQTDTLYEMAMRINKKRSFLFVSKVLGKHIPLYPQVPFLAAALLAAICYEEETKQQLTGIEQLVEALSVGSVEKLQVAYEEVKSWKLSLSTSVIFIGFAETATALGHSVFDCFSDAVYIHSTREVIVDKDVTLYFEEEHSHATEQRCYATEHYLMNDAPICLVDDEITTGKTVLNIITSIQKRYPRKKYIVLSLLDWRNEDDIRRFRQFEEAHGVVIKLYSLMSGTIEVEGTPRLLDSIEKNVVQNPRFTRIKLNFPPPIPHYEYRSVDSLGFENRAPYLALTGRFGITSNDKLDVETYCEQIGIYLQSMRKGKKTLCLGTGEFMYIPMKVALYMGKGVYFHSTTRSPIFPMEQEGYPIKNCLAFNSPDDPRVMNYVYNVLNKDYDEVFLLFERPIDDERLKSMMQQFIDFPAIHIVDFT